MELTYSASQFVPVFDSIKYDVRIWNSIWQFGASAGEYNKSEHVFVHFKLYREKLKITHY